MNLHMLKGHTPHGRLDDSYSVSDLRKPRPLYNFSLHDKDEDKLRKQQQQQGLPFMNFFQTAGPHMGGAEFATAGSYNNSAAGSKFALSAKLNHKLRQPSNHQMMESHLRLTYGDELFDSQQYTTKGLVGIAGLPSAPVVANSNFQAMRGRILGPVPSGTFPEDGEEELDNENNGTDAVFQWCDRNNSAEDVAKTCARRAGAKIMMRRGLSKWIFLYFRVRRVSWEFMVYEEKMNCSTVDLFSDNVLDRWTVKLRFKMLIDAPMKYPLMAFLARMGLDTDPDIVFSVDGFFGDMLVGGLRNKNSIPHRQVSFNTTPEAMGLQNGDNIFVVKANSTLRNNVESHMEMAKRRANKADGEDEEEEDDDADEEEEEHH